MECDRNRLWANYGMWQKAPVVQLGNVTDSSRDPIRERCINRPRLNSGMWQEEVMIQLGNVTESSRNPIRNVAESARSPAEMVGSNTTGGMDVLCVVNAVCCQVEVYAMGWSLIQRSPTDCVASLCVIYKHREWGDHGPLGGVEPKKNSDISFFSGSVLSVFFAST